MEDTKTKYDAPLNESGSHIGTLAYSEKTARNLSTALKSDYYHDRITESAKALCAAGYYDAIYQTSYSSGNTYWMTPEGKALRVLQGSWAVQPSC